ncbi:hypothetical protein SY88_05665 [Clostridiales bacterium PH28_bin88]|nr:hypothetical protein SY88_05665 [Clostridiales bacterium PH28_bin88]
MKDLHFTIGPVQGFVAQSRRTRDLWAGSFLLSYLAGHAMLAAILNEGNIKFPYVHQPRINPDFPVLTDELIIAIYQVHTGKGVTATPWIGSLPNRFLAEIPDDFDPGICVQAVKKAWRRIADVVWEKYLALSARLGCGTEEIWQRQIDSFWEMSWVIGEQPKMLDWRKNWRTHVTAVEPGDKCTLMGNLQELSGYTRARERAQQNAFWEDVRARFSSLDLQKGERLSAVAFVKRFFPKTAEKSIGWRLPEHYPSTAYMAAVHWMAGVSENEPSMAAEYARLASQVPGVHSENPTGFPVLTRGSAPAGARSIAYLNADCFFEASLANRRVWPQGCEAVLAELRKILKEFPTVPRPYYALLLMDGDLMGVLISEFGGQAVSRALQGFTTRVEPLVRQHNGMTIYAGGDDVLAMFPLEDALRAAAGLVESYKHAFAESELAGRATASTAIVYAHYNIPLMSVYKEAHRILEDVAKEKTGRDSLGVTVWKGSGPALTWSAPWGKVTPGRETGSTLLDDLVRLYDEENEQEKFSSRFFYKFSHYFRLFDKPEGNELLDDGVLFRVLVAEYLKAREGDVDREQAEANVRLLLAACRLYHREQDGTITPLGTYSDAGALLVRFLGQKGGEPR